MEKLDYKNKEDLVKNIYIIGGSMGVGKTMVGKLLKSKLPNSVFLDGDWCWDMNPFQVTAETKDMVMDNICYLLNNYIKCSVYENIIFCWVLQEQATIDTIMNNISCRECETKVVSLVCDEETLRERLQNDINDNYRTDDIIEKSIRYMPLYDSLKTIKIDTSRRSIGEIAKEIKESKG